MRPSLDKMNTWLDFDGHYEKHECDIMLKDGTVLECYWPNAGRFFNMNENGGKKEHLIIDSKDIDKVRYHDYLSRLKH